MARWVSVLATLAVAAAAVGGCGSGSSPSAAPTSTSTSPSSASPPSTPASPRPSRIVITGRTAADLTKVLLEERDMPRGFTVKPDGASDTSTTSSTDPKCAPLAKLMSTSGPGVSVRRVFTGGERGPIIEEGLTAQGSAKALESQKASFRAALSVCHAVTVRIPGRGASTVRIREIPAPQQGTGPVAFQVYANDGPLRGLEMIRVVTGVHDVAVSMTFIGLGGGDIAGATKIAVAKANDLLATKTGT